MCEQLCNDFALELLPFSFSLLHPKGPKIEKIQDRPPGLKFSIEIENFNLDPQQTPIFVGNSEGQDWNFQSIEIFKRD